MKFKPDLAILVSILLLFKTAVHSVFLPRKFMRAATSLDVEEWNEVHASAAFLLLIYFLWFIFLIAAAFEVPTEFAQADLTDQLFMLPKVLAPAAISATLLLSALVLFVGFILLILSRREFTKENATLALRITLLLPIPFIALRLAQADRWLTFTINDSATQQEVKDILSDGLQSKDMWRLLEIVSGHWQFWISLWPWVLSLGLLIYFCGFFIATGWQSKRQEGPM